MKYLFNTFLILLLTIFFTACSEQTIEETSAAEKDLIDAVEANAEIAPAKAMQEMKLEVEETADEMTEEISLVAPDEAVISE